MAKCGDDFEGQTMDICHKKLGACSSVGSGKKREKRQSGHSQPTSLAYVFDKLLRRQAKALHMQAKQKISENFRQMNMTGSYESLFELLWYTQQPCFDVKEATSTKDMEHGMLKACYWRGKELPCALIFKTSPTDRGMCCTFNLEAAETMFREGPFTRIIDKMQMRDRKYSFQLSDLPDDFKPNWEDPFENGKRPVPQAGMSKGLTVILDAHSEKVASSSVREDVQGFSAIVESSNQYPLTFKKSLLLRPGHENMVSLKATKVTSAEDLANIDPVKRQCYFEHEKELELHQKYSQSNCMLECSLHYSLQKMNGSCIPWYFPIRNNTLQMCDPWVAFEFADHIRDVPDSECLHCLPDCSSTLIEASVSAAPFRKCDRKNFGISELCNFESKRIINPPVWGASVKEEYGADLPLSFTDIKSNIRRTQGETQQEDIIFKKDNSREPTHNAYEKDIALVTFFFESSTAFEYVRQPRMTIIDFISQLGGLLGLCMGFSFISAVEIAYWFTIKMARRI